MIALCGNSTKKRRAAYKPGALVCCRHFTPTLSGDKNNISAIVFEPRRGLDGDQWLTLDDLDWTGVLASTPPPSISPVASPSSNGANIARSKKSSPKSPFKGTSSPIEQRKEDNATITELWAFLEAKFGDVAHITEIIRNLSLKKNLDILPLESSPAFWKIMRDIYSPFKNGHNSRSLLLPLISSLRSTKLSISDKKLADNIGSDVRTIKKIIQQIDQVCNQNSSFCDY